MRAGSQPPTRRDRLRVAVADVIFTWREQCQVSFTPQQYDALVIRMVERMEELDGDRTEAASSTTSDPAGGTSDRSE
jgi:hypothetical protein